MLKYPNGRMDRFRTALLAVVLLPAVLIGATASGQTREAAVRGIGAPLDIAIDPMASFPGRLLGLVSYV